MSRCDIGSRSGLAVLQAYHIGSVTLVPFRHSSELEFCGLLGPVALTLEDELSGGQVPQ